MSRLLLLASVIAANLNPPVGQIGANYFDTLKQSQVWINLEPRPIDPAGKGAPPVEMNFTAAFPGKTAAAAPKDITLRVQAYCLRYPTHLRIPELTLVLDDMKLDLAGDGLPASTFTACGGKGTTVDGLSVTLPFDTLRRISGAKRVQVHAVGFDLVMSADDQRALGRFVTAVSDGVTIR